MKTGRVGAATEDLLSILVLASEVRPGSSVGGTGATGEGMAVCRRQQVGMCSNYRGQTRCDQGCRKITPDQGCCRTVRPPAVLSTARHRPKIILGGGNSLVRLVVVRLIMLLFVEKEVETYGPGEQMPRPS